MFKRSGKSGSGGSDGLSSERIADIAHELRAPLGGIEAMIELLASTRLDGSQERLVMGLRAAAEHLRAVASDVLQGGSAGIDSESRRQVEIHQAVGTYIVSARARALSRGIDFHCEIAPACDHAIVADGVGLRQILENLTDNAMRFTAAGAVTLRVTPALDGNDAPHVRFEVLDQGPGLTRDEARRIFGRRVTLAGRSAGAGLGLSIVAALVSSLGGTCGAEPRSDMRGAHLWFTMPVVGYRTAQPAGAPATPANGSAPILVVDDHPSSRLVLQTILEHIGFAVEATGQPQVALRMIAAAEYCAVFTDMMMPEMDGCAFVEAIRRLGPPTGDIPVICVTGHVSAEDKRRLIAAGGQVVVEKPIAIAQVKKAIATIGLIPPPAAGKDQHVA